MFDELIVKPIFNALMLLYSIIPGGDFGVAIILFTIFIRILIYPLVRKQLHQTKLMRKMQPEIAKIKKEAKGNKQLEATMQMELYKRHGISPFQSIFILLIQLPIFIGLYYVIQIIVLHRNEVAKFAYAPLEQLEPIKKIIENPENFNHTMLGFIDLTKTAFSNGTVNIVLLVLALISAVTQYIMSKQTMPTTSTPKRFREIMKEAAEGKQSDPADMSAAMMRNMVKIMPIMMFFIMVNLPGALALYYTVSNLIATAQQHYLLNKDTEEMEEIAEEVIEKEETRAKRQATAKKRAGAAKEGNITRIKAKG